MKKEEILAAAKRRRTEAQEECSVYKKALAKAEFKLRASESIVEVLERN